MEWKVRKGPISELNRDFDYEYWQALEPSDRLGAAWQLVVDFHVGMLGQDEDQLRLQRSLVAVQRRES